MDANSKKTALRMIPYGLYVLTAEGDGGEVAAATVNWVTQVSFEPPLVVVGVKADSSAHALIGKTRCFALNVLGKDHKDLAFAFFKPTQKQGDTLNGQPYRRGATGSPILTNLPAYLECRVREIISQGDHSAVLAEVVDAGVAQAPAGRADDATLWLKDLGEKMYYGG
jgi:flavin reductase (DIM6/NTAB) family NADH-FMN oxidoreductase RutF